MAAGRVEPASDVYSGTDEPQMQLCHYQNCHLVKYCDG